MNTDPKKIIIEFLDLIGYEKDKDVHAEKFLELSQERAVLSVIDKLPKEEQDTLIEKLKDNKTPESIATILSQYASKEEYTKAFTVAIQESFNEYLDEIVPTLNESQIKSIDEYFEKLSSENPQTQF